MLSREEAEKLDAEYRATQNDVCIWARTLLDMRRKGYRELEERTLQKLLEATEKNDAALRRLEER